MSDRLLETEKVLNGLVRALRDNLRLQHEHLSSDVRCGWAAGHGARTDVQEYAHGRSTGRDPAGETHG